MTTDSNPKTIVKRIYCTHQPSCLLLVMMAMLVAVSLKSNGQEGEATEPKIDFTTHIQPILQTNCTTCHNESDEEGGLNLENMTSLMEFVVIGKPLESGLYRSITGTHGQEKMPPAEDNEGNALTPLAKGDLALLYLWIQQGASLENVKVEKIPKDDRSVPTRVFLFTGYFHPAIVHFPIALLTISAFFIVFCFRNASLSDDAAYYLLLLGTLSAIVSSVLGWAFAERSPVDIWDFSLGINRHRWFGIGATSLAVISTVLGWRSRNEVIGSRSGSWKLGVLLTAALIGIVGHQGGEEVYGEGFYDRAAERLIPEYWPFEHADETDAADQQPAADPSAEDGNKKVVPAVSDPISEEAAKKDVKAPEAPPVDPTIESKDDQ